MKTTLDIHDALLARAKRHAKRLGKPLRALVEDGLRAMLSESSNASFTLADCSVGEPNGPNPLESLTQDELRELMHGGR